MVKLMDYWSASSELIREEAIKRGYGVSILDEERNFFEITSGENTHLFRNIDCGLNSALGLKVANDKYLTKVFLEKSGLPTPQTQLLHPKETATNLHLSINYPVVVKPVDGSMGEGVSVDIQNTKELKQGITYARKYSDTILLQEYISGSEYRVLLIGDTYFVAERCNPHVIGDGVNTIQQLVHIHNSSLERHQKRIVFDAVSDAYIKKQSLKRQSIPKKGQTVVLRGNSNASTGGFVIDRTSDISEKTTDTLRKIQTNLGLQVIGIDILTEDIACPLQETGSILEIGATPGIRLHHYPDEGVSHNVAGAILDLRFNGQ